jgi:hypothetical protein
MQTRSKPGHLALYIPAHGQYETDTASFDTLLAEYGTWSLPLLRGAIQKLATEEHGMNIDYSDLRTVTECLFVMAELSGLATN